jgi:amino acid adenylation domain-containing protein
VANSHFRDGDVMSGVIIFDAELKEERDYWLKRLAGITVPTRMLDPDRHTVGDRHPVCDVPPLPADIGKYRLRRRLDHRFDTALTTQMHRLTAASPFLLYALLVSALKVCLSRYTGAAEVVVASPPLAEYSQANALVIVGEVRCGESFRELLLRVRQGLIDAYAHQRYPYHRLLNEAGVMSDETGDGENMESAALFDVAAELEGFHGRLAEAEESLRLRFKEETLESEMRERDASESRALSVSVDYDERRYSHHFIMRFIIHFEKTLRMAVADAGQLVDDLEMLSAEERRLLLAEWNQTERPYPRNRRIHDLFTEQAERTPERVALISEGQRVSYRELNRRTNHLAHYLQRLGVGPEVVVGLCLKRSVEMIVAVIGALKAGGAYLPLDPEYPPERLGHMLNDIRVGVVVTQQVLKARLPDHRGETVCLDEEWEMIGRESESEPQSEGGAENLAYVIYTSGSTGRPKGVMVAHEGVCNLMEVEKNVFRLGDQSRVLQFASLSFDASVWEIFSTLAAGGSLCLYRQESLIPGSDLVRVLREDQVTTVTLPPTVLAVLGEEELFHLQTIIAAGEACPADLIEKCGRGRRFFNAYGPTEATVCASIGEFEAGSHRKPTIGRPIANIRLYILDHQLRPVPLGAPGELYIAGVGLARGYWRRPEPVAEKFIPNPFNYAIGERLYRTGDLGRYLPNGEIEFIGRADDQVKVRGYRIELGEIEAWLNSHPAVKQSVAVASEDEGGSKRLVGYVVGEEAATATELKRYLIERLPEYMVPEVILILAEMPVTANGKIDRKRLPSIKDAGRQAASEYVAPRTAVEETLVEIFKGVLKLERVGVHDSFFELGGHSLLVTKVNQKIRARYGVAISLVTFFQHPTVAELGDEIDGLCGNDSARAARYDPFAIIQPNGSNQPLFCVHPLGGGVSCYIDLARELGADQPVYGLQAPSPQELRWLSNPHHSIEEMASFYLEAVRHQQPEGPYLLAGWSYGGIVAFEMAKQLEEQNLGISLLAILDSRPPTTQVLSRLDDTAMLVGYATEAAAARGKMLHFSLEDLRKMDFDTQIEHVMRVMMNDGLLSKNTSKEDIRGFLKGCHMRMDLIRRYQPGPYHGRIKLFRAIDVDPSVREVTYDPSATYGWDFFTTDQVDVLSVPGTHASMMFGPHTLILAETLKPLLIQVMVDKSNCGS